MMAKTNTELEKINTELENILNLLNNSAFNEYAEKRKEFDLDKKYKFNIFETISDTYYKENFHTDILFSILDPNTPEIGPICNEEILKEFVKTVANDNSFEFTIDATVNVSKQEYNVVNGKEGYIDLLITNSNNQAIIIENKINDAKDMKDQLVRYMSYVKEEVFKNDSNVSMRVVYLTLLPGKTPNIKKYNERYYSEYKKMLETPQDGKDGEILKYRSAIGNKEGKLDLCTFLNNCMKHIQNEAKTENCKEKHKYLLKKNYLEQYMILLGHLGGTAIMSKPANNVIEKIYSNQNLLQAAKAFYEVLVPATSSDKRSSPKVIEEYINKFLYPILEEMGFEEFTDKEDKDTYPIITARNNNDYLYACGQFWNLQIGFGAKNKKIKSKGTYRRILKTVFPEIDPSEWKNEWVYVEIEPTTKGNTMKKFLESYKGKIEKIKNAFLNT